MKIVASRKDEILKRKAQWEADNAAYEERENNSRRRYREAELAITQPVEDELTSALSRYSALKFDVTVDSARWGLDGLSVRIRCNENNKFDDDVALAWSWEASLTEEGEVIRESSSWSGLSATTEAQMKSLRQTVSALEYLNDLDWASILNKQMPKYEDYYDVNDRRPARENWDEQLVAAELDELVGTNKIVKVRNWGESCPFRGDVWLQLLKETPSQYRCNILSDWDVSQGGFTIGDTKNVRKSSVKPYSPMEVKDIPNTEE